MTHLVALTTRSDLRGSYCAPKKWASGNKYRKHFPKQSRVFRNMCASGRCIFGGPSFPMTIKFKGVDLDGDLERIIPHVATADEYGGALQQLQTVWDNLTLLGQLSGAGTDMSDTRAAFSELAAALLNQLGREAL